MNKKLKKAATDGAITVAAALAAGLVVAPALGAASFYTGIVTVAGGAYLGNQHVMAAGAAMIASNNVPATANPTNGVEGVDGIKDVITSAKNRVKASFNRFTQRQIQPWKKPVVKQGTSGLGDADVEYAALMGSEDFDLLEGGEAIGGYATGGLYTLSGFGDLGRQQPVNTSGVNFA